MLRLRALTLMAGMAAALPAQVFPEPDLILLEQVLPLLPARERAALAQASRGLHGIYRNGLNQVRGDHRRNIQNLCREHLGEAPDYGRWVAGALGILDGAQEVPPVRDAVLEDLLTGLEGHRDDLQRSPLSPGERTVSLQAFQNLQRDFFNALPDRGYPRLEGPLARRCLALAEGCLSPTVPGSGNLEAFRCDLRDWVAAGFLGIPDVLLVGLRPEASPVLAQALVSVDLPPVHRVAQRPGRLLARREGPSFPLQWNAGDLFHGLGLARKGALRRALEETGLASPGEAEGMQALLDRQCPGGDREPLISLRVPVVFLVADFRILGWGVENLTGEALDHLGRQGELLGKLLRVLTNSPLAPDDQLRILERLLARMRERDVPITQEALHRCLVQLGGYARQQNPEPAPQPLDAAGISQRLADLMEGFRFLRRPGLAEVLQARFRG